jgi:hypothetical protein
MNICILGGLNTLTRETANSLKALGHTVSFLPAGPVNPANKAWPFLASFMQQRLEQALFPFDAVLAGGDELDYARISPAMHGRPLMVADGESARREHRRFSDNAVLLCRDENGQKQAKKQGFQRTIAVSQKKGPGAFRKQLTEALELAGPEPAEA